MTDLDRLEAYDYILPAHLIAKQPPAERTAARLLVLDRTIQRLTQTSIAALPELLAPGDLLVLNDSRVVPARLVGQRAATGGRWEGLFLERLDESDWKIIGQTRGTLQPGEFVAIPGHGEHAADVLRLELRERLEGGAWRARPALSGTTWELLDRFGELPLPPYIERDQPTEQDAARYQTVYAERPGSVAAPTAGLHFTPELLAACVARGIETARVTLHVGLGTFRPVSVDHLSQHTMHSEWCELGPDVVTAVARTRARSGRVIAVGTTSCRTLEAASAGGELQAFTGKTQLFIRPPYSFRTVNGLLTNFHLPKSTLLMLVSALGGYDFVRRAYAEAISSEFRFYSYGDAMLIL